MSQDASARLMKQITEICTFLPTIGGRPEFTRLRVVYERGGKHMLDSENVQQVVDAMHGHVRELRKLARLFALECNVNLAKHSRADRR